MIDSYRDFIRLTFSKMIFLDNKASGSAFLRIHLEVVKHVVMLKKNLIMSFGWFRIVSDSSCFLSNKSVSVTSPFGNTVEPRSLKF
jgi:hypothetical protein